MPIITSGMMIPSSELTMCSLFRSVDRGITLIITSGMTVLSGECIVCSPFYLELAIIPIIISPMTLHLLFTVTSALYARYFLMHLGITSVITFGIIIVVGECIVYSRLTNVVSAWMAEPRLL